MNSVLSSVRSLMQTFDDKVQEFISDIDNVHMVWLREIQQEAEHMFSRDFNAEPELMPKTPSQKKNSRRKRVSMGRQEDGQSKRRFSKGRRSNLRGSSVKSLNLIAEEEAAAECSASEARASPQPKRTTRKNQQTQPEVTEDSLSGQSDSDNAKNKKPELLEDETDNKEVASTGKISPNNSCDDAESLSKVTLTKAVVKMTSTDRLSAELAKDPELSPGRTASKITITGSTESSSRSSVRCSLKLRHSLAGLRHSMTQESVRRASRRSMMKRKAARAGTSTCSSDISEDSCVDSVDEEKQKALTEAVPADMEDEAPEEPSKSPEKVPPAFQRVTRSVAANSPALAPEHGVGTPVKRAVDGTQSGRRSQSTKRKAPDSIEESPSKRLTPPKKSHSVIKPNMKSFLHTVQKNQMLMMTPNSLARTGVIKSFVKYTTPVKVDPKSNAGIVTKERYKLEALKKKQEQEEERMKKVEEEKRRKQDELKKKRDERLKRVFELKVKEELKEEEKKKKIEQKMAQIDEKNDKRLADEKAKRKVAVKRQEELEQKKKLEEEARKKKIQQAEEEKRQQELLAKKKAEEEEQKARKLAEARKALELKREQERERELERELERERQAAAERERLEKEKALALQREVEKAAREKERRELEEKRRALEEKRKRQEEQLRLAAEKAAKEREAAQKAAKEREAAEKAAKEREAAKTKAAASLNVTVDIEKSVLKTPVGKGGGLNVTIDLENSPQSYVITPKGGNKPLFKSKSLEDYGMDQNSDDSTDDESAPKKPIPSWAEGPNLQKIIMTQYFNPPDFDSFFGRIDPPRLENIFYKTKPRYFKRTSSAVWHSPPNLK